MMDVWSALGCCDMMFEDKNSYMKQSNAKHFNTEYDVNLKGALAQIKQSKSPFRQ